MGTCCGKVVLHGLSWLCGSVFQPRPRCLCGAAQTPYLHFIAELLRALPGRAVVLMEVRGVSVSLTRRAVSADDIVSAAAGILARHGWASAAWVGHSYGTFVLSRLVQTRRELVQSLVLIDPVCMLTIYPQVWGPVVTTSELVGTSA